MKKHFMDAIKRQEKDDYIGIKIEHQMKRDFEKLCLDKDITVSQGLRNLIKMALESAK